MQRTWWFYHDRFLGFCIILCFEGPKDQFEIIIPYSFFCYWFDMYRSCTRKGDCNDQRKLKTEVKGYSTHPILWGVLVSYNFENGSCCGQGIVHRAYHVLEEYTVLLRDGSKEEVCLGRKDDMLGGGGLDRFFKQCHKNPMKGPFWWARKGWTRGIQKIHRIMWKKSLEGVCLETIQNHPIFLNHAVQFGNIRISSTTSLDMLDGKVLWMNLIYISADLPIDPFILHGVTWLMFYTCAK